MDRAAFATALVRRLRERGVPVGMTAMADFTGALWACPPETRQRLYWAARITLVRRQGELAAFDRVFEEVFGDLAPDPRHPDRKNAVRARRAGRSAGTTKAPAEANGLPWATLAVPSGSATASASAAARTTPLHLPTARHGDPDTPFEDLDPAELDRLGQWLAEVRADWPIRRGRRRVVRPHGRRVALRATLRRARRTGFEPLELVRESPRDRPRRVVMLCDVSRSMQAQATAYLHLMHALAVVADAEVFAFATTLTRLTAVLTRHSAETAVAQATDKVTDRFGGTRIATAITTLLASHHGGTVRGAIVLIASDGWDGDPPEALAAAMAALQRRAHTIVWLNPRAAAPGFEPRVSTMAAALPYCDLMLPAHSFAALREALTAIAEA